jgi:hypothetical protein
MIWYDIYLLTPIVLAPGGNSTVRIYIKKKILINESYTYVRARTSKLRNFFRGPTVPRPLGHDHYWRFTITLWHTTLGRPSLDGWSARWTDLYLTKPNTHKSQTSTSPAEFDLAILISQRPQTYILDREAGHWDWRTSTLGLITLIKR